MVAVAVLSIGATLGVPIPGALAQDTRGELLQGFREGLQEFREGDEGALVPLRMVADRLCGEFGRCDVPEVLAFYAGLAPADRRAGLEDERRYLALRDRVVEAGRLGSSGETWAFEREDVLAGLRELIVDARFRPDFVPAAQAHALCAQVELRQLEERPDLPPRERAALADRIARDAEAASTLFETAGQVVPRLEALWIRGRVERMRGRPAAARDLFELCQIEALRVGNDSFRELALDGLLSLAIDGGDVLEQERILRTLAEFRSVDEHWPVARGWGELLILADHAERALEFIQEHEPSGDPYPVDRIDWHLLMGGALLRVGMHSQAREHFEVLAEGPSADLAALALARLALAEGRSAEAIEILEDDRLPAGLGPKDRAEWHALVGEASLQAGDLEGAVAALERALDWTDVWDRSLSAPRGSAETTTRSVMGEWRGLHTIALLADALARSGHPLEALRVIEDAQSRSLRDEVSDTGSPDRRLGTADVLTWARHAELGLVTWVVGSDFSVVAWAGPGPDGSTRALAERLDLGRRSLEDAVRRLREAALAGGASMGRVAAQVRDGLFPPSLLERLRAARAWAGGADARLLLLLHGPLERLPVEALELDGEPLDDWLTPLVLPGLPADRPDEPSPLAEARWVLMGAPVAAAGTAGPALPGASEELERIARSHGDAYVISGPAFRRESLLEALRGSTPLHVATHLVPGCAHRERRLAPSSFLLSDGETLCVHEVASIRPRAPLVVLSACASGEGRFVDAQGLQGMARAFLEAGTRNVLVTLWPVEDRAAAAFSAAFHRALREGAIPSGAAREARASLRARRALSSGPADWAAFRLLGRD